MDDLLRRLGSGVRPAVGTNAASLRSSPTAPANDGFIKLIGAARAGEIRTTRAVHAPAKLEEPVDEAVLAWLSVTLDAAESQGSRRLAAVAGNTVYLLDVIGRRIETSSPIEQGGLDVSVDSIAILPTTDAISTLGGTRSDKSTEDGDDGAQRMHAHAESAARTTPVALFGVSPLGTRLADELLALGMGSGLNPSLATLLTPAQRDANRAA